MENFVMGLRWDPLPVSPFSLWQHPHIDLDASAVLLDAEGGYLDAVYFDRLSCAKHLIVHAGDDRRGTRAGDDEVITVRPERLPAEVHTILFTVTSHAGHGLGRVPLGCARLYDLRRGRVLVEHDLSTLGAATGLIMARLGRTRSGWKAQALCVPGQGKTYHDLVPQMRRVVGAR